MPTPVGGAQLGGGGAPLRRRRAVGTAGHPGSGGGPVRAAGHHFPAPATCVLHHPTQQPVCNWLAGGRGVGGPRDRHSLLPQTKDPSHFAFPLVSMRPMSAALDDVVFRVLDQYLNCHIRPLGPARAAIQVQECGLQVTERQAPRLHTLFAAACEAVGFQSARDAQTCRMGDTGDRGDSRDDGAPAWGPRLYVLSSPETAVYCVRIPVAEVTPPGHQRPQSHQPQQTSALRVGASSPGEPTLATGATTEDEYSSELRSTVLTSAAVSAV